MEIGSASLLGSGPRCCSRVLIIPFLLLCLPVFCCLACAGAGYFITSPRSFVRPISTLDAIPPVQTLPAIPGSLLDPQAVPVSGSASLAGGFSPDPYRVDAQAGGSVDTVDFSPPCGYTSYHPAFVLDWQGDASGPFLRIFFTPDDDDTDTSLLVHTPGGEWLCREAAALDLPSADPGEYAIWLGTFEEGTTARGSLSITGSQDVTP